MNPATRSKIVTSVLLMLPGLAAVGMFLAPATTPKVIHALGTLVVIASLPILARREPAWVRDALGQADKELREAGAPPVAFARVMAKASRRTPPTLPVLVFAFIATGATIACGASALEIEQSVMGGVKAADCVLALVLGGQTDPLALVSSCGGVTLEEILAIIDDFSAHTDAGPAPSAEASTQARYLAEARANTVKAIAAKKASGK